MKIELSEDDVLLIADVQVDFVTGTLSVPEAADIVPVVNRYIAEFDSQGLPIVASRDWHPPGHVSFKARGGPWPEHCVAGTRGAQFLPGLELPRGVHIVSKGVDRDREAYSAFQGTGLGALLRRLGVRRIFVGGLATDYCVLATVKDAIRLGYEVYLLTDAIRAVDARPGDGAAALRGMLELGARPLRVDQVGARASADG